METNGLRPEAIAEVELVQMLRSLPVSIQITRRGERYIWQFLQGNGSAPTFLDALREALTYLEATRMTDERS